MRSLLFSNCVNRGTLFVLTKQQLYLYLLAGDYLHAVELKTSANGEWLQAVVITTAEQYRSHLEVGH